MNLIKPSFSTGYAKNASESANPNLWKGLVGAWMPSFGVTGNTLKDVSGNGNDGTLTNMDAATDWVATSKGLALDFDGSDDYVEIGKLPTLGASPLGTTIVSTLRRKWFNTNDFIFDGSTSAAIGAGVSLRFKNDNKIRFWNYNANYFIDSTFTVSDSNYHQIVGRHYSGENSIFFDGNKVGSKTGDLIASNNGNFRIGSSQVLGNPSAITIHGLFAYNRALSPTEIKQLYLNPLAPFERKQQTVGISTTQAFNPYWANQATQLAGTLQ